MKKPLVVSLLLFTMVAVFGGAVVGASTGMRSIARWMETVRALDDRPVSEDSSPVAFAVRPGSTGASVGQDLMRVGLIRSATAFRLQLEVRDAGSHISVGEYQLRRNMTLDEIIDVLTAGKTVAGSMVTIPEGWRSEEIAQYLEARGVVDASAFMDAVAGRSATLDLSVPSEATTFEGYLFPDTYDFGRNPTPDSVVTTFVDDFHSRVTRSLATDAASHGLSMHEMVTLASIVEREATEPEERPEIAAVFENRMARGMPLQADPTVQYAQVPFGLLSETTFWKRSLSTDDLKANSPYNTYQVHGLPPGPICNPGLASIKAVANPSDEPWLYFVAKGDGSHLFASTLDEHNRNVAKTRSTSTP